MNQRQYKTEHEAQKITDSQQSMHNHIHCCLNIATLHINIFMHATTLHIIVCNHNTSKLLFQHSCKPVRGTGFIAELQVTGQNMVLLMTSYNVLPSLAVAKESDIYFGRISDDNPGTIIKGRELFRSEFFKTDDEEVS